MVQLFFRNVSNGQVVVLDKVLPYTPDIDDLGGEGEWEVIRPSKGIKTIVTTVKNTVAPFVSGDINYGGIVSGTLGTWTGSIVSYNIRWIYLDGNQNVVITGAVTNTWTIPIAGYEGRVVRMEVQAVDNKGRLSAWVASNNITIPPLSGYIIPDANWNVVEADATNLRKALVSLSGVSAPVGFEFRAYVGSNPDGDASAISANNTVITGTSWISPNPFSVGSPTSRTTVYVVLYRTEAGGLNPVKATSTKTLVISTVPDAPTAYTLTPSTTVSGEVSLNITTLPNNNGQTISGFEYTWNSGQRTTLSGGTSLGPRILSLPGTTQGILALYAMNINGSSASVEKTVTPPVIAVSVVNTTEPTLFANIYGGGSYKIDKGTWTGNPSLFSTIEMSDDGINVSGVYANNVPDTGGTWPLPAATGGYVGKYFRVKVTPNQGAVAVSPWVGPLKEGFDRCIRTTSNSPAYYYQTISMSGLGLSFTDGIWFSCQAYYDGSKWSGHAMGFGNSSASYELQCVLNNAMARNNFTFGNQANLGGVTEPGWYHMTWWFKQEGTKVKTRFYRNKEMDEATDSTLTLTASQFNRLVLLARSNNASGVDIAAIHSFALGTGDPTNLHEWATNVTNNSFGNVKDYDYASDPTVTLKSYWRGSVLGSTTFDAATQLVDEMGFITGTWTEGNGSNKGYTTRKPAYINSDAPASVIPEVYISPRFGTVSDTYSFQSRYPHEVPLTSPSWAGTTQYYIGDRVNVSGTTYRCMVEHLSGTWATDLSAGKWTPFIFTINSLTHSVLGDITSTISGNYFTCNTPGTYTASVTVGGAVSPVPGAWVTGTSYTSGTKVSSGGNYYQCFVSHTSGTSFTTDYNAGRWKFLYGTLTLNGEIFQDMTMPAVPKYANLFNGNGLVCAIEQYPDTTGNVVTTVANTSDLATLIGTRKTGGGFLTIDDVGDFSTSLVIPPGNYNGLVVQAKNPEGIKVTSMSASGCSNLTVQGFAATGKVNVGVYGNTAAATDNVWLKHGRFQRLEARGKGSNTAILGIENCISWDADIEIGKPIVQQMKIGGFKRIYLRRFGAGKVYDSNVLQVDNIAEVIADRVLLWDGIWTGPEHCDMWQTIPSSGNPNRWSGMIRNSFIYDYHGGATDTTREFQGIFWTDCKNVDLHLKRVLIRVPATNGISLANCLYNVRADDCSVAAHMSIDGGATYPYACFAQNNIQTSAGDVLGGTAGRAINTLSISDAGFGSTTVWPDYNVYQDSWRKFRPASGYETRGAGQLVLELEAKRIALGL